MVILYKTGTVVGVRLMESTVPKTACYVVAKSKGKQFSGCAVYSSTALYLSWHKPPLTVNNFR